MVKVCDRRCWCGLVALLVIGLAGCQTMDNLGLGGKSADSILLTPAPPLTGPKPIKKQIANSAIQPPSAIQRPKSGNRAVRTLVKSQALTKEYNSVAIAFLGNEAKRWMQEKQRKAALDQAVTALKQKINITKNEQVKSSMGTAVGLMMQLAGGDVGKAGRSVAGDYYMEMDGWIDAAFDLAQLDYKEDASRFFEHGMKTFPYADLKGRCAMGYAMVHPDEAYEFLMAKLEAQVIEEVQVAIRMLGHLAASENMDAARKSAIMAKLIGYSKGIMNASYHKDAIYALDVSHNAEAVPALKTFMKGMMVTDELQRPALTSLALNYKDMDSIVVLRSILNAGMMASYDWADKQFAFRVLVRAGDDSGYMYAEKELKKAAKGFFADKNDPDLKPGIVNSLVAYGDARGARVMGAAMNKYEDDRWIKTWMATGMLLLGDSSQIDLARANLNTKGWESTSVDIARALAMYGDTTGIATLQRLANMREVPRSPSVRFVKMLAGADNTGAKQKRLERLRSKIAYALGQIDQPACVPILNQLLTDQSYAVRRSAATALTVMTIKEALPCMTTALDVDYGMVSKGKINTSPTMHAKLVRAGGNRWGGTPELKPLLEKAAVSRYASVQLLGTSMWR